MVRVIAGPGNADSEDTLAIRGRTPATWPSTTVRGADNYAPNVGTVRNFECGGIASFGNVAQRCATGVARPVNSLVGACVA